MKRTIENPYSVNHKTYIGLVALFFITLMISFIIPVGLNRYIDILADLVKNLSYGCIASTVVAWLIDCANIRNANKKANRIYDTVYGDLRYHIGAFIGIWAQLCTVAFKDKEYDQQKDTWESWYKTVKLNYYKATPERQKELLSFFRGQLSEYARSVNNSIERIQVQRYMLTMNDAMNKEMDRILSDFQFEFHALDLDLSRQDPPDLFWAHMDAVTSDLLRYIDNWSDIRYYNLLKFVPYKFFNNRDDALQAVLLSDYTQIIKQKLLKKEK